MDPMDEDRVASQPVFYGEIAPTDGQSRMGAGGNIYRDEAANAEVMDLPNASSQQTQRQSEIVEQLELKRRMKSLVVPTADSEVRQALRSIGEPITLYGEKELERRDRLRKLLATSDEAKLAGLAQEAVPMSVTAAPIIPKGLFYTEGSPDLQHARMSIAHWSLIRAAQRIETQKRQQEQTLESINKSDEALMATLQTVTQISSEVADDRPVIGCVFSPEHGRYIATGSWSGCVKLWDSSGTRHLLTVAAHADRLSGLAWQPYASGTLEDHKDTVIIASGATDSVVKLWSGNGTLLHTLTGHSDRLGRIAFHPMGQHVASASFDLTWRLWDVNTGVCLLEQEGHSRAVYTVAFQCDGSLAASGGMDSYGRVWDLRSGRSVFVLEGHIKALLALDFSPNGYHLATGGEDNTARVYDLRKKGVLAVLPGHTSLISQVKFDPCTGGQYLLTAGYDNLIKLWGGRKYKLTKTLAGHEGKVMGADICPDAQHKGILLASTGYDRTLKLWEPDRLSSLLVDDEGEMMQA